MLLLVDARDRRPIYQQLRDQVVEAIADGRLQQGARLPTTRQLAVDLGINFHTVLKAYDLLRQEGYVELNRRTGVYVYVVPGLADFASEWRARLRTVLAEARAKGLSGEDISAACSEILRGFGSDQSNHGLTPG